MTDQEIETSICHVDGATLAKHISPKNISKKSHFGWSNEIQGHLLSGNSYGFVIGNILGGPICGYLGGKKSMAITLVFTGLSQLASPLASYMSHWLLFLCQFIAGICVSVIVKILALHTY